MEHEIDYGKLNKRIVFTENDHRHVNFLMKLKSVGLTQSKFFRYVITGMISDDPRIYNFIEEISDVSIKKKNTSKKMRNIGIEKVNDLGLNDGEVENIFDIIAEEFPGL
tara:strand:+ start:7591 stop:7917 length:327 start_codon:yes stop_codon:yes gene_type:complete